MIPCIWCFDLPCPLGYASIQLSSTLVLKAHCPICFRCLPAPTHLIQMNGHYQALQKPDEDHSFESGVLPGFLIHSTVHVNSGGKHAWKHVTKWHHQRNVHIHRTPTWVKSLAGVNNIENKLRLHRDYFLSITFIVWKSPTFLGGSRFPDVPMQLYHHNLSFTKQLSE